MAENCLIVSAPQTAARIAIAKSQPVQTAARVAPVLFRLHEAQDN